MHEVGGERYDIVVDKDTTEKGIVAKEMTEELTEKEEMKINDGEGHDS